MFISLLTSRFVLNALGIEDYGIYNAVGGVVSMLSFLTAALSASISRYITYEMGREDSNIDRLKVIFSTSIRIQLELSLIVLLVGEVIGVWFLNAYMNIPADRLVAANWVWQCCLFSFIINLISIPYNASIIAHEHMNAYALVSIIEASLKLLICYLLVVTPTEKLITYAFLQVCVAIIIRLAYGIYCSRNFQECKYTSKRDKELSRNMFSFAGFSFINNSVSILNHQGINLLINIFFGVLFNAARGVASHVEGTIMQLVNNITVAVNPQITKSYAAGDKQRMFSLICKGSKYAYFLMLLFALPVFIETDYLLELWLKTPPDYSSLFLKLALIGTMMKMIGNTGYTACMATGNIKRYSIWVFVFGITAFPLTLIAYKAGLSVEYAYYSYILTYFMVEVVRLVLMKQMIGFSPSRFIKEVAVKSCIVTIFSAALPYLLFKYMEEGFVRFVVVLAVSIISVITSIYLFGLSPTERKYFIGIIIKRTKSVL